MSQSDDESLENDRLSGVNGESGLGNGGDGVLGRGMREGVVGADGGSEGSRGNARLFDLVVKAGAEMTRFVL